MEQGLRAREYGRRCMYGCLGRHTAQEDKGLHRWGKRFNYETTLRGHCGCVNTISFNLKPQQQGGHTGGEWLASGSDDRRVLLWNVSEALATRRHRYSYHGHLSNIFCTLFDQDDTHVFSSGNDQVIIRHNLERGGLGDWFVGHSGAVHSVSVPLEKTDTHTHALVSASDDGSVVVWDVRDNRTLQMQIQEFHPFTSVKFLPHQPHAFITGSSGKGVRVHDLRQISDGNDGVFFTFQFRDSMPLSTYRSSPRISNASGNPPEMNVCGVTLNADGTQAIVSIRSYYPALLSLDLQHKAPLAYFHAETFRNFTTIKQCCFAGSNHEFVVAGSDSYEIFVWKIPLAIRHASRPAGCIPLESGCMRDVLRDNVQRRMLSERERAIADTAIRRQEAGEEDNQPRYFPLFIPRIRTPKQGPCVRVDQLSQVLIGHRSIPNQLAYHPYYNILLSSGVEKSIRVWSSTAFHADSIPIPKTIDPPPILAPGPTSIFDGPEQTETIEEDEATIAWFDYLVHRDAEEESDESDEMGSSENNSSEDVSDGDDEESSDSRHTASDDVTTRRARWLRSPEANANSG